MLKNNYSEVRHIGIIGLGSIGRRHLRLIRALRPRIEITVVRSGLGRNWPEVILADRVVESVSDAINLGIQAAIICTPAIKHVEQSLELVDKKIHILVEKPLSHNSEGVLKLIRAAKETNVVALVGYVLRYDLSAIKFLELFQSGRLGKILHARVDCGSYLPDWRPEQDYKKTVSSISALGGGVLLELSHELDYVNWFFGAKQVETAYLSNSETLGIEVEDSVDLVITSKSGFPISVHMDFYRRRSRRICAVYGVNGDLKWNVLKGRVDWKPINGDKKEYVFDSDRDDVYKMQLNHFLRCIENGDMPRVSLAEGAEVVSLVEVTRELDCARHYLQKDS